MKKVSLNDIPQISTDSQDNILNLSLNILADGERAKIFISKRDQIAFSGDDKIVIIWEHPNKIYGESFTTKYFSINEPGLLHWGTEDGIITLEHLNS
ncbi:hypothetical protein [Sediminibacterium sp.]|uniref:hypothetical protein n=1 Tax=Sediminibacterium sp. TaxID=1917865 RepID=UPI0025FDF7A0|nr:hypothetical protein [Sediminibacterium sp.]